MSHTLTIRITERLMAWLREEADRTGIPVGRIIREHMERVMDSPASQPFMRHAGKINGPPDLSSRKGFSRS
jgi:hypothetical protein